MTKFAFAPALYMVTSKRQAASMPAFTSVIQLISQAFSLRSSRRALARLDADILIDLGISPRDAAHEAARPLWNVPAAWRT